MELLNGIIGYLKEVSKDLRFQISATITFGTALLLVWLKEQNELKIFLTILFLFPFCMFLISIVEKSFLFVRHHIRLKKNWNSLTPEETEFVSHYLRKNTKTKYVPIFNGAYSDCGIINPLIDKEILYLASDISEFRGDVYSGDQRLPINITDKAFRFFSKKSNV